MLGSRCPIWTRPSRYEYPNYLASSLIAVIGPFATDDQLPVGAWLTDPAFELGRCEIGQPSCSPRRPNNVDLRIIWQRPCSRMKVGVFLPDPGTERYVLPPVSEDCEAIHGGSGGGVNREAATKN